MIPIPTFFAIGLIFNRMFMSCVDTQFKHFMFSIYVLFCLICYCIT